MQKCNIIPVVKKIEYESEKLKLLPYIYTEEDSWTTLVDVFCISVRKMFGLEFQKKAGGIRLVLDKSLEEEAYIIEMTNEMVIKAADYQGCAYGIATALQLIDEHLAPDKLRIEDKPDKDYRGLMIDLARKWHPFAKVLHYVDVCFFYKVKYLHLHFMDDQGYTLPSVVFPKLSVPGKSYTFEEIQRLCIYAKERGIVIVPEIEMPGHARSLVEGYPELFGNQFDSEEEEVLTTEEGVQVLRESVICAGSDEAFQNITKLIDEVIGLFPGVPYIHLGADEVNVNVWENCPVCRKYIREKGFKDTQELYADFVARVTEYVLQKGIRPIVWEGVSKEYSNKLSKNVIVIGWECHYQNPDDLIEGGFEVINCSWKPLYITRSKLMARSWVWHETDILKWNVYEWQHWWEKSAATLNPFHISPTDQVIGAQLCEWEMTYECGISTVVIRLAALSERTWSIKRYCSEEEFWTKLGIQMDKLFRLIAVD